MIGEYQQAVANFATTGDEIELWDSLRAIGFENGEIQWHADRPGLMQMIGEAS